MVIEITPIGGPFAGELGSGVVGVSDPGAARSVACNGTVFETSDPPKFMMPIPMLRVGAPVKLK